MEWDFCAFCIIFLVAPVSQNHQVYSDKFTLPVLNLTQIHKATEEDKNYDLDNCLSVMFQLQNKGDTAWEKFL